MPVVQFNGSSATVRILYAGVSLKFPCQLDFSLRRGSADSDPRLHVLMHVADWFVILEVHFLKAMLKSGWFSSVNNSPGAKS